VTDLTSRPIAPYPKLDKYGYNCIARYIGFAVFTSILLFLGAGRVDWVWGWVFSVFNVLGWAGLSVVLARENPELLNQRGKRANQLVNTKSWDWAILSIYGLLLVAMYIVAGLDARFTGTTPLSVVMGAGGVVLLMLSFVLLMWAMSVNRFFEGTVRIQASRGQQVVTSGPYHYVRHPGYVAVILQLIATPLVLGSSGAWIPAILGVLLFILRTALEDRTLQSELPGYSAYIGGTPYRLLPGIW
jgi:protein-S-isoprenylcysteine O-methyltransferase Ste14